MRGGASRDTIAEWMADRKLVDPIGFDATDMGMMRCIEMYTNLHLLPGFCLPEFLRGTRMAYEVVTRKMYERDWETLRTLVAPDCLDALMAEMDAVAGDARRVVDADAVDAITIRSATLNRVALQGPDVGSGVDAARRAHLDVRFETTERWTLHDYREHVAVPPLDGTPFAQRCVMRWEGDVRTAADADGADGAAPCEWRLVGLQLNVARGLAPDSAPLPW